jgi:hypothetical protein
MAPLDPPHFSSGPVPYTSLATESEDPLHLENDPHAPSPRYRDHKSGPSDASTLYRSNPLIVDGNPRSQIEFYEKELNYLRIENARLRDQHQQLKDKEVEQLRQELPARKNDRDGRRIALYMLAIIGVLVLMMIASAQFAT